MDRAKALDKIRKCLRLAKSSEPHEAAAALRQAQTLMREYDLDENDVHAAEVREASVRASARRPVSWEVHLVNTIAAHFACRIVFAFEHGVPTYVFMGLSAHAEIASYAFATLLRQAKAARTAYIAKALSRCGPSSKTARADAYCAGWVLSATDLCLALVPSHDESRALDAYSAKRFGDLTTTKGRDRRRSLGDRISGLIDGERARLDPAIGGAAKVPQLERSA